MYFILIIFEIFYLLVYYMIKLNKLYLNIIITNLYFKMKYLINNPYRYNILNEQDDFNEPLKNKY